MPGKINVNPIPGLDGGLAPGHTDAQLLELRAKTADARHRQASGMPPARQASPQDAPQAQRVDVQLAGQVRDKQLRALTADLARLDREAQRPLAMMGGVAPPNLIDRQRQVRSGIEAARQEIERLVALDGQALIDWAESSGLIRWSQNGSAVL